MERIQYLRQLRHLLPKYGAENIVYFDESGFETYAYRPYGWAKRGKRVYGNVSGNNRKRTNLIMAQRQKEWLAPMLFEVSCNSKIVNLWIEKMLLPELKKPSIIIMDNARFHNKAEIGEILEKAGHELLPLPRYSPDFNPIEKTFAHLKKRRQYAPIDTPIDELFLSENI